MSLKYLSVCAGIEAASTAWHDMGWKPVAFSEIEAFPSAVLATRFPGVPNLGDMTKYESWPEHLLADVDLVVGGCPCQAFSMAGLRNSQDDARGQLTLVFVRLINYIDSIRKRHGKLPVIAVYENVPGIYTTKDNAFGCLVGALCGQDAPVETETGKWPTSGVLWGKERRVGYRTLDAQFFGVPQRRRRCFLVAMPNEVVGHFGDQCDPAEILAIPESLCGNPAPSRESRQDSATAAAKSSRRGRQSQSIGRGRGERGGNGVEAQCFGGDVVRCLTARNDGSPCADRGPDIVGTLTDDASTDMLAFNTNAQVDQMNFDPFCSATLTASQYSGFVSSAAGSSGSHWDNDHLPHPAFTQAHNAGGVGQSNQEIFGQRGAYLVPTSSVSQPASQPASRRS